MYVARKTLLVLFTLMFSAAAPLLAAQHDRLVEMPVETLDRVVLTIQGAPYTQSDLVHEYRLEKFLASGKVPEGMPSPAALAATLPRFIDQKLLEGELGGRHFDAASISANARRQAAALRKKSGSQQDFDEALRSLGMNPAMLTERFAEQEKILEMINGRLRPEARINEQQIAAYYQHNLLPEVARARQPAPSLQQAEGRIREVLIQKKINQLLDEWLVELRKQQRVEMVARE